MMLLILAAVCLASAVYVVANIASAPARERANLIRRAANYGNLRSVVVGPERLRFRERVVGPSASWLASLMLRVNPKQSLEQISRKLMSAGMRNATPQSFLAAKGAAGAIGLVGGLALGSAMSFRAGIFFSVSLGGLGYMAPGVIVSGRAKRRREAIVAELPDALDLLAVSVEAGMGFDGAIAKLCQYMDGILSEEFELALGEMRIGESRSDALKKMGERVDAPEVGSFVRSIVQADQLGTSLGRTLRVQATDTRLKRQMAAEERAMKAPIKMLFPTVAFIFPAMFIVILGPAMLSLSKLFDF
jgi:tight adherence protein C